MDNVRPSIKEEQQMVLLEWAISAKQINGSKVKKVSQLEKRSKGDR